MTEETNSLSWEDLDDSSIDEEVTDADLKAAESLGRVPVGKYLCECISSEPRQKDFKNYSCLAANLRWNILKVIELDGQPVKGDAGEIFEGRSIFDDINLYSPAEKDGMRNRRILVAKRTGLIGSSAEKITKKMWQVDIIGKKTIITYINDPWFDEKTKTTKPSFKVAFDGYDDLQGIELTDDSPDIDQI